MANSKDLGRAGTSTFALKNRPRATRAMVAKVRTGCITCKRRHVKCDENKPACHRCLKWRGTCEGYEERLSNQSRTKQEPGTSRSQSQETDVSNLPTAGPSEQIPQWYPHLANEAMKLLSRPSDLINAASPMSPNPSPLSLELPSSAVPQHSGLVGSFWMQTVPALLRANSSVKYANLAIHALIDSKRPQWVEEGPKLPGRDSYSRALRYHGQAIGAVREKTAGRESLQSATLCSLFFIIFEMMNGDVNAAQAHMYNGCRMMAELRAITTGRPVTGVENMLFRELQKALRFVAMQVQGAVSNYEESKPVKTEVEVKPEPKTEAEADADVCKKEEKEEEQEEAKPSVGMDAIKIKQEPHTPLPTD